MIVLDENIAWDTIAMLIRRWYPGRVCSINDLLPKAVIKDDLVPRLLANEMLPTFVTGNVVDFWQVAPTDLRYCIISLQVPTDRPEHASALLR